MPLWATSILTNAKLWIGLIAILGAIGAFLYVTSLKNDIAAEQAKNAIYQVTIENQNNSIRILNDTVRARNDALLKLQDDYSKIESERDQLKNDFDKMIDDQESAKAGSDNTQFENDFNKKFNDLMNSIGK